MDLQSWAAVAGIGGLALAAATFVFRDVIARDLFAKMPARLTYQLLRLIVVCAFILGLVGVSGWIWLQSISQARATASKQQLVGTLDDVLSQIDRIVVRNATFAVPALKGACYEGTNAAKWIVARNEMKQVSKSIEQAKQAIVAYISSTQSHELLVFVDPLSYRLEAMVPLLSDKIPPSREECVLLSEQYQHAVDKLYFVLKDARKYLVAPNS